MNVFPFSAIFRAPLSGDVAQEIAPDFAGVPAIERRVTAEVASYGSQLGTILDAVAAMAERDPGLAADPRIARALALRAKVEAVKAEETARLGDRAQQMLDSLHRADPAAHAALIAAEARR
ncbi:hypothetical protein [Mangrovicoccus algicola]|uniref:Uncharacterized protein n=1 Tax=Mangrovicoccus algicola TaxID=2771008 RepID=A0A8J7CGR3_9RHOB|nr:hypothetical protein [Mangrovicoccus algicola]MBE3637395.1 hypothetical protein [Mangrovicoccus algicola]